MKTTATLILCSKSPRRKELLEKVGLQFSVLTKEVEEIYPESIDSEQVAEYLANLKSNAFAEESEENIIIAADTTVVFNNEILGKPNNETEAKEMLTKLSGKVHKVISGVSILHKKEQFSFSETTLVEFKKLSDSEINYYITNYKPFDKAGGYGIQEWIGLIGIKKIEGDYYNVMGLPSFRLYNFLIEKSLLNL